MYNSNMGFYNLKDIFKQNKKEYNKIAIYLCGRPLMVFDEVDSSFIEISLIHKYQQHLSKSR